MKLIAWRFYEGIEVCFCIVHCWNLFKHKLEIVISQQIGKSTRHIEYDLLKNLNIFESETIGETQKMVMHILECEVHNFIVWVPLYDYRFL